MAVFEFFGLPGSGKTTILASLAYKFTHKKKYKKRYTNIYCNVPLKIDNVVYIDNSCIGEYLIADGALFIDEATLFANNRDYKNFSKKLTQYFLLHRHYNIDIYLFTQEASALDKKIRTITDRVYYVYKGIFLGKWISCYYRIPYGIIIPDGKKDGGEKLGEIIQGYCKPPLLVRIFSKKIFRPRYYKYFDSWDRPELPELPSSKYPKYISPPKPKLIVRIKKKLSCFVNRFKKKKK